jgi:hypothetical protein
LRFNFVYSWYIYRQIIMKRCPACNRAYADDSLSFCLEDGSILSAPDEPNKTLQIPAPQNTDSILTKVSYRNAKPPDTGQSTMPTLPSTQLPITYAGKAPAQTIRERPNNKLWAAIGVLGFITVASVAVAIVSFSGRNAASNNNAANNTWNSNQANLNNSFGNNRKTEAVFSPWDYQASLNGENLTYYPGTTPEQCQADCARNEKCKAFTFIRAGAYNPQDSAMCYLASLVTGSVRHACCISAVKR